MILAQGLNARRNVPCDECSAQGDSVPDAFYLLVIADFRVYLCEKCYERLQAIATERRSQTEN